MKRTRNRPLAVAAALSGLVAAALAAGSPDSTSRAAGAEAERSAGVPAGPAADEWPQFRGLHRDGVSAATGLLASWPAEGPREVWRRPLGEGFSGVASAGGRLYTMYAADVDGKPTEFAAALAAADGKEIWRTRVADRYDTQFGNGPRATPTVHGDTVYVFGARGTVMALAAADGNVRWQMEVTEAFGSKVPTWGFSGSILLDDGKVLVEGGGADGKAVAALDPATGKVLWTAGNGGPEPGYNTPLAVDLAGTHQSLHFIGTRLTALDPAGKELWSHAWPEGELHAMPIFVPPDMVFGSGVEGVGGALLRVEGGADGMKVTELWKNPTFRTHFNAAVRHGDHLYGFDNTTLKCVSLKDGSVAWVKRGLGKGSLILADGRLVILADDGRLVLADASPQGYTERGVVQALTGRCWTPPALAGGRIYLRNHAEIVAYDVKG
jgi:outer membrane protein assembly factor BamB